MNYIIMFGGTVGLSVVGHAWNVDVKKQGGTQDWKIRDKSKGIIKGGPIYNPVVYPWNLRHSVSITLYIW